MVAVLVLVTAVANLKLSRLVWVQMVVVVVMAVVHLQRIHLKLNVTVMAMVVSP